MKSKLLLFVLLVQSFSPTTSAYDAKIDGIYYDFSGNEAIVTYAPNSTNDYYYSGSITIPESFQYKGQTYHVTSIGDKAFSGARNLKSITIPKSITSDWGI